MPAGEQPDYTPPGNAVATVGVSFSSETPAALPGTLTMITDDAIYAADIPSLPTRPGKEYMPMPFMSGPLFIGFPKPVHVLAAYVSELRPVDGAPISCLVVPATNLGTARRTTARLQSARRDVATDLPRYAAPARYVMPFSPPQNCPTPFVDATVTRLGLSPFTTMEGAEDGTGTALVAVGPDGSVLGTRIVQTSGSMLTDQAVLRDTRNSQYAPAKLFCTPVAEFYLLKLSSL